MRELTPDRAFLALCGFREQSITKRYLLPEEVTQLFQAMKLRDRMIFQFILELGLTPGEVSGLEREHFEWGVLAVAGREVEPSPSLAMFLESLPPGRVFRVGERTIQQILTRSCKVAGISPTTCLDLRRTFAVYFLAAGGGIDILATVLGMTPEGTVRMLGLERETNVGRVPAHRALAIIVGEISVRGSASNSRHR